VHKLANKYRSFSGKFEKCCIYVSAFFQRDSVITVPLYRSQFDKMNDKITGLYWVLFETTDHSTSFDFFLEVRRSGDGFFLNNFWIDAVLMEAFDLGFDCECGRECEDLADDIGVFRVFAIDPDGPNISDDNFVDNVDLGNDDGRVDTCDGRCEVRSGLFGVLFFLEVVNDV